MPFESLYWLPIYLLLTFFLLEDIWLHSFEGPWPKTFRSHMRSKYFCLSKVHTSLPVWYLLTFNLRQFLRYLASKFIGCDLDLSPLEVTWGRKYFHHLKTHAWLPILLLLTFSLYLVPFSRCSTLKFLGFDLDLWPLEVTWGQKYFHHSKAHIWLPI